MTKYFLRVSGSDYDISESLDDTSNYDIELNVTQYKYVAIEIFNKEAIIFIVVKDKIQSDYISFVDTPPGSPSHIYDLQPEEAVISKYNLSEADVVVSVRDTGTTVFLWK